MHDEDDCSVCRRRYVEEMMSHDVYYDYDMESNEQNNVGEYAKTINDRGHIPNKKTRVRDTCHYETEGAEHNIPKSKRTSREKLKSKIVNKASTDRNNIILSSPKKVRKVSTKHDYIKNKQINCKLPEQFENNIQPKDNKHESQTKTKKNKRSLSTSPNELMELEKKQYKKIPSRKNLTQPSTKVHCKECCKRLTDSESKIQPKENEYEKKSTENRSTSSSEITDLDKNHNMKSSSHKKPKKSSIKLDCKKCCKRLKDSESKIQLKENKSEVKSRTKKAQRSVSTSREITDLGKKQNIGKKFPECETCCKKNLEKSSSWSKLESFHSTEAGDKPKITKIKFSLDCKECCSKLRNTANRSQSQANKLDDVSKKTNLRKSLSTPLGDSPDLGIKEVNQKERHLSWDDKLVTRPRSSSLDDSLRCCMKHKKQSSECEQSCERYKEMLKKRKRNFKTFKKNPPSKDYNLQQDEGAINIGKKFPECETCCKENLEKSSSWSKLENFHSTEAGDIIDEELPECESCCKENYEKSRQRKKENTKKWFKSKDSHREGAGDGQTKGVSIKKDQYHLDIPGEMIECSIEPGHTPQRFQVFVNVLEARQIYWANENRQNSFVEIIFGKKKYYTDVKRNNSFPVYNKFCVFDLVSPTVRMLTMSMTFNLRQPRCCCITKLLGSAKVALSIVWQQPRHQFHHKWATLTVPHDANETPRGFLKLDIGVLKENDTMIYDTSLDAITDIDSTQLMGFDKYLPRSKVVFNLNIYRAINIQSAYVCNPEHLSKSKLRRPNTFIKVSICGIEGKTGVSYKTINPEWNSVISVTEIFPNTNQNILIELLSSDCVCTRVLATARLDMYQLSHVGHQGFLPTYGPAYLHMYSPLCGLRNTLNAGGCFYRGSLLLSLNVEPVSAQTKKPAKLSSTKKIDAFNEEANWPIKDHFLTCLISDVSMIDLMFVSTSTAIAISIGPTDQIQTNDDKCPHYTKPLSVGRLKRFGYANLDGKFPLCKVNYKSCDHRPRIFIRNNITKISRKLKANLEVLERKLQNYEYDSLEEMNIRMDSTFNNVKSQLRKYFKNAKNDGAVEGFTTLLDRKQVELQTQELEEIYRAMDAGDDGALENILYMNENAISTTISRKSQNVDVGVSRKLLRRRIRIGRRLMERLNIHVVKTLRGSYPIILIWLVVHGKRVAYVNLTASDVIYSPVFEKRGDICARNKTLFLKPVQCPKHLMTVSTGCYCVAAKVEVNIWFGLLDEIAAQRSSLTENFSVPHEIEVTSLLSKTTMKFRLTSFIYRAKLVSGSDESGLADPFVIVNFYRYQNETKVIKKSLCPVWDEVFHFRNVELHTNTFDVVKNPPPVIVEVFDKDICGKSELIGRVSTYPYVELSDNEISRSPMRLRWYKIYKGSLYMGELLMCSQLASLRLDADDKVQQLTKIPDALKPHLADFKMDVYAWGVRSKKDILCDCYALIEFDHLHIKTTHLKGKHKNLNFDNSNYSLEVSAPVEKEYCPPVCIKIFRSSCFGCKTFMGINVMKSPQKYLIKTYTEEDRSRELMSIKSRLMSEGRVDNYSSSSSNTLEFTKEEIQNVRSKVGRTQMLVQHVNVPQLWAYPMKLSEVKKEKSLSSRKNANTSKIKPMRSRSESPMSSLKEKNRVVNENNTNKKNNQKDNSNTLNSNLQGVGRLKKQKPDSASITTTYSKPAATAESTMVRNTGEVISSAYDKSTEEQCDWWNRFHDSIEGVLEIPGKSFNITIFPIELENVIGYSKFKDWCHNIKMYSGKRTGIPEKDLKLFTGYLKVGIQIYAWSNLNKYKHFSASGADLSEGYFQNFPKNSIVKCLVRVYILRGIHLASKDYGNTSDPYIMIMCGNQKFGNRKEFVAKDINPVFGKLYEFTCFLPQDYEMTVSVWDYDRASGDDLIGLTKIDLENRFYSKHRAFCGIASVYRSSGCNKWRDSKLPSDILNELCTQNNVGDIFIADKSVTIANQVFDGPIIGEGHEIEENICLFILKRWAQMPMFGHPLVPEHVETRSLFLPNSKLEQGKLQMWIDMFEYGDNVPEAINITRQHKTKYQLRVIVWSAVNVPLDEKNLVLGQYASDIFIKGWLTNPRKSQRTDVHYRSVTGEGVFNWRMIFNFLYSPSERKIIVTKEGIFKMSSEEKHPTVLNLQVLDNDFITANDILGSLSLNLSKLPIGAATPKKCNLDILTSDKFVNLFKVGNIRAWWPFQSLDKEENKYVVRGKADLEINLLTIEEADLFPAGPGREAPQKLPEPNRPDSSFSLFRHPLKTLKFFFLKRGPKFICKLGVVAMLIVFVYFVVKVFADQYLRLQFMKIFG